KNCIPKESHLGVVENNKYSYIKISQLILTGSRGKSALLIPTTNLHYQRKKITGQIQIWVLY
ncbi:MAG: hypothetical protein MRZ93_09720, partial [Lachnospiraceae bacterium]|nr:hypothetical protein [Lachnospiraceae bacterium]